MRGAGKKKVPVIISAEDLLIIGGKVPRRTLGEIRWAEHIRHCHQVARFCRIWSDIECRMRTGEGSESDELSSNAGSEREDLAFANAVPMCVGPEIPDCALNILDLIGKLELRSKPIIQLATA